MSFEGTGALPFVIMGLIFLYMFSRGGKSGGGGGGSSSGPS